MKRLTARDDESYLLLLSDCLACIILQLVKLVHLKSHCAQNTDTISASINSDCNSSAKNEAEQPVVVLDCEYLYAHHMNTSMFICTVRRTNRHFITQNAVFLITNLWSCFRLPMIMPANRKSRNIQRECRCYPPIIARFSALTWAYFERKS